jgi:hypothetical protein
MGRLSLLGGNWLYRQEYRTVADDLKVIRGVTLEDIQELLKRFPIRMTTTAGVGPLSSLDLPTEETTPEH